MNQMRVPYTHELDNDESEFLRTYDKKDEPECHGFRIMDFDEYVDPNNTDDDFREIFNIRPNLSQKELVEKTEKVKYSFASNGHYIDKTVMEIADSISKSLKKKR